MLLRVVDIWNLEAIL